MCAQLRPHLYEASKCRQATKHICKAWMYSKMIQINKLYTFDMSHAEYTDPLTSCFSSKMIDYAENTGVIY